MERVDTEGQIATAKVTYKNYENNDKYLTMNDFIMERVDTEGQIATAKVTYKTII